MGGRVTVGTRMHDFASSVVAYEVRCTPSLRYKARCTEYSLQSVTFIGTPGFSVTLFEGSLS